jgi:hypothetical protein
MPFVAGVLAILVVTAGGNAAEWGSIKGRFVVDGTPPAVPPLPVDNKDPFCLQAKPKNEALIVGENNALANAVVYLRLPRGKTIDAHPDYEAQLSEPVAIDNNGCSFQPHITLVRVGQTLLVKNSDPTGHNTNINVFAFNNTIPAKSETPLKVSRDTPLPMPVVCNIHPFMKGHLLAQKHPYMAVSGEDGTFAIENVPVGKHEFQFWHEAPGYLRDLKIGAGKSNRQGRVQLTIAAGKTLDLGDIRIPARMLNLK